MSYRFLADALVVFHLCFVVFVILGGLPVLKWRRVAWLHIPAALWGVFVEWSGWICPLTPIENRLREAAGEATYQGGFVDHYIMPVLYPAGLTRNIQFVLGAFFLTINLTIYYIAFVRRRRVSSSEPIRNSDDSPVQA